MLEIVRAHRARYPLMEPQDAVKLLYQRAFGPGHMIESRECALERLQAELGGVRKDPSIPLFEPLGAGLVRMNLASPAFPRPETAAGLFFASEKMSERDVFRRELDALVRSWPESGPYVASYRAKGCPQPGHSEVYRAAYHPAYRVVSAKFQRLIEVFKRIDEFSDAPHLLIAIDGRCGAGKTSLSRLIASVYGAMVLHMDDFFQTEEQKSAGERAPVANIDGARLMAALKPLSRGEAFEFRSYNCLTGEFLPPRLVRPGRMSVVEGSYCLHPEIRLDYDLRIFLTVDPETQKARLKVRNPELYDRFIEAWIPQEETYFKAYNIAEGCLMVDGRALSEPPESEEP
jgi:uridine kinase